MNIILNTIYEFNQTKGKKNMFFKSLVNLLSYTHSFFNNNTIGNANPNIIKYYQNEYGANWKVALEHHLYKESLKNGKKAA